MVLERQSNNRNISNCLEDYEAGEKREVTTNRLPGITRIGVRRIVIEVNRDMTVEQIELLDETLKKLGLVEATKITLHDERPHRVRPQKLPQPDTIVTGIGVEAAKSEPKGPQSASS